ncbi:hypothetical protein PMAYCL1PPCAC_10461, partial [Pristionchus mayeri]
SRGTYTGWMLEAGLHSAGVISLEDIDVTHAYDIFFFIIWTIRIDHYIGTVTLDMIFAKICEVHTDVQKLAVRVERVEKKQRDIVNDTVGIRHEVRILNYPSELTGETAPSLKKSVILSIISYEYKCLGVKYGIYEGHTEERVDALDDEDDNCLVFAGNLDRLLFKKSPLPHQQRDQDKVKWLIEVVTHRRCQGPGREKRRMKTQLLQRINVNAKRVADRLNRPSSYTPPTLISKTRIASRTVLANPSMSTTPSQKQIIRPHTPSLSSVTPS